MVIDEGIYTLAQDCVARSVSAALESTAAAKDAIAGGGSSVDFPCYPEALGLKYPAFFQLK